MPSTSIFVSHKSSDSDLARSLVRELKAAMDDTQFFLSEQIPKGRDWRQQIETQLAQSDHLVLLYTNENYDWSWCVYETTSFWHLVASKASDKSFMYCIHPPGVAPPDPLQAIQTVRAKNDDITKWLTDFYTDTGQKGAFSELQTTAANITQIIKKAIPRTYSVSNLRPSVLVFPAWSDNERDSPDWNDLIAHPRQIPLENSQIEITDEYSVSELGFNVRPPRMHLVEFLERLDSDKSHVERPWIVGLLQSLQRGLEGGGLANQEVVFFRSAKGGVLRPIIDSITRSVDGSECKFRIVFVDAFASPPVNDPSKLQLLANGLRMAVRTRIEVLDKYEGRMAAECARLTTTADPAEELIKLHPLGGRVLETLRTILIEAEMQGYKPSGGSLLLFDGKNQDEYQQIRDEFKMMYEGLIDAVAEEDHKGHGEYSVTEAGLKKLRELNNRYLRLATPRFVDILGVPPA